MVNRTTTTVLLTAVLAAIAFDARAADTCPVAKVARREHSVAWMPKATTQGSPALSFADASMSALQQFQCSRISRTSAACPASEHDRLSIRDGITTYFDKTQGWDKADTSGGDPLQFLNGVGSRGTIARDECAPASELQKYHDTSSAYVNTSYFDSLKAMYEVYQTQKSESQANCAELDSSAVVNNLTPRAQVLGLAKFSNSAADSLSRAKSFGEFASHLVLPDACQGQRMTPAKFRARALTDASPTAWKINLAALVAGDRAGIVSLCGQTLGYGNTTSCKPRQVLIGGSREMCCQNQCETQYRVYTTEHMPGTLESDGSAWVSEATVFAAMQAQVENVKKTGPTNPAAPLTWIEAAQ